MWIGVIWWLQIFEIFWGFPPVRPSEEGNPPPPPEKKICLCFQLIPNFQFYYNKEDVYKKQDPNILKIGWITQVLRNWPISDQFCLNLKKPFGGRVLRALLHNFVGLQNAGNDRVKGRQQGTHQIEFVVSWFYPGGFLL